jgi:hypothetical protein
MPAVTVPRADLTTDEVVTVLRDGLGAGYNVLPRMAIGRTVFQGRTKDGRTRSWSAPAGTRSSIGVPAGLPVRPVQWRGRRPAPGGGPASKPYASCTTSPCRYSCPVSA